MYDYQIAVYVDGIESMSESIVVTWRRQIEDREAYSRLIDVFSDLVTESASHIQIRDAAGNPLGDSIELNVPA